MTTFSPIQSLFGGALIGLSVVMLMAFLGRIAGSSGIIGSLLPPNPVSEKGWRIAFLAGLTISAFLLVNVTGYSPTIQNVTTEPFLIAGGIIVGVGVTLSSGCTSGHGICGLARLSPRSIAATLTFMASTAATVFIVKHLIGE
ncbi:MAG: YeeE/YedE family protein [Gammaproteobacteria bacterium]|nr:YeeE/YedE family protein [Gammaproteobacteria bacterium]